MKQEIKQLSQIEHVLKRPSMYIGSIVLEPKEEFVLEDDKFVIKQRSYNPGLIKIFNELIDNTIDEYIRTNGEYSNKVSVKMTENTFEIQDNGRGIPNETMKTLKGETKYQAEVAFTEMLSGANYENDDEATIGTNGLGSKASSIFSLKSIIKNDDGNKCIVITTKDHLGDVSVKETSSKNQGIHFKIWPDLEYFGMTEIDEVHQNVIKERLLHLSIAYPGITFKFNGRSLKLNQKNYFGMFDIKNVVQLNDNVTIGVGHSPSEQFEQFSLVNGLITKDGRHTQDISNEIVTPIREKLAKKFKTIKPADIKNKLRLVIIFRGFPNARYDSQTKEVLKNSSKEIKEYLGDYDLTSFIKKIQKDDDIMLHITELFLLKEQAKQNAELKKLKKTRKLKLEKYLPATKRKKYLLICEGASAVGGLMPGLGRDDFGYFELKGVPLNAYETTFTNNKELTELYQVIENEGYEYILAATDADADGSHIQGLLIGFIKKHKPELLEKTRFGTFRTPVQLVMKNGKPVSWVYELGKIMNLKSGETGKYMKGLGSYKTNVLKEIIKKDGIEKMTFLFDLDDSEILNNWLSSKTAEKRKEYLQENEFDITGV